MLQFRLKALMTVWKLIWILLKRQIKGSKTTPKCNEILFSTELGQERSVEPGDTLGHLQIKDLPGLSAYPQLADQKYSKLRSGTSNTNGYMWSFVEMYPVVHLPFTSLLHMMTISISIRI